MKLFDYPASANCYKVRLALAQLNAEYERVPVDIFAGDTLTVEFRALNAARITPVLQLDDGRTLVESNAILVFLADGTELMPSDRLDRAQVVSWLIYEQTDVMPTMGGLRFRLRTGRLAAGEPAAVRRHRAAVEVLEHLDEHLNGRDFCVAERYSVADIALYAYVHVADEAGIDMRAHRHIARWLQTVRDQPGHIDGLAPYPANARRGAGRSIYD